jgi:Zn-dependent protease
VLDTAELIPKLIIVAIFLLIAFPVHEFAHAAVAYLQGDATAKLFGRLSLNPIVHFDPFGGLMTIVSVIFTGFIIGWAKPTPVNPANLHDRRNGEVLVALAGPASNFLMALVGAFIFRLLDVAGVDLVEVSGLPSTIGFIAYSFVLFNVLLAIFNFIPVPPLDGSTLLYRILTPRQAWQVRPFLTQYGIFVVLAVVLLFSRPLSNVVYGLTDVLVGL